MIIYLAGFKSIEKYWNKQTDNIYLLSSYMEHKEGLQNSYVNQERHILDSGAFTFLNSKNKKKVNWDDYVVKYGNFIKENDIKLFFELDIDSIIGIKEVERLRGVLEKITGKQCIPVWHKSRGLDYWERLVNNYNYIAIGGIVTKEIKSSEYPIFTHLLKIAKKKKCKVHGLGFTNLKGVKKYSFYSVDSTNWLSARFGSGGLYLFKDNNLKHIKKPKNTRKIDLNEMNLFNFKQWVKFQQYAKNNL